MESAKSTADIYGKAVEGYGMLGTGVVAVVDSNMEDPIKAYSQIWGGGGILL